MECWEAVSFSRILCKCFRLPLKLLILETNALALSGADRSDSTTSYSLYARSMGSETFQPGRTIFADGLMREGQEGENCVHSELMRQHNDLKLKSLPDCPGPFRHDHMRFIGSWLCDAIFKMTRSEVMGNEAEEMTDALG